MPPSAMRPEGSTTVSNSKRSDCFIETAERIVSIPITEDPRPSGEVVDEPEPKIHVAFLVQQSFRQIAKRRRAPHRTLGLFVQMRCSTLALDLDLQDFPLGVEPNHHHRHARRIAEAGAVWIRRLVGLLGPPVLRDAVAQSI